MFSLSHNKGRIEGVEVPVVPANDNFEKPERIEDSLFGRDLETIYRGMKKEQLLGLYNAYKNHKVIIDGEIEKLRKEFSEESFAEIKSTIEIIEGVDTQIDILKKVLKELFFL